MQFYSEFLLPHDLLTLTLILSIKQLILLAERNVEGDLQIYGYLGAYTYNVISHLKRSKYFFCEEQGNIKPNT